MFTKFLVSLFRLDGIVEVFGFCMEGNLLYSLMLKESRADLILGKKNINININLSIVKYHL